jgi:hypothetical protein
MPYKSAKQSRYLHSQKPEVAARFDADIKAGKKKAIKKGKKK